MLSRLSARNFSLLRDIDIAFEPGLTVISGESGAGKSLVIDALLFALGKRSNQTFIGTEADECAVDVTFELSPATARLLSLPPALHVHRSFARNGRGGLEINGEPAKVNDLREMFSPIVDISTQFAQQDIFRVAFHRKVLDSFGNAKFKSMLESYRDDFCRFKVLREDIASREDALARGMEERNYLAFLIGELGAANISSGEKERIAAELYALEHAEEILRRSGNAAQMLYDSTDDAPSAFDLIAQANQELRALASNELGEGKLARTLALLEAAMESVSEAKQLISDLADVPDYSPAEVERLRRRVDEINSLEHKYRAQAEELPILLEQSLQRLEVLSTSPEALNKLKDLALRLGSDLVSQAKELNARRREIGKELEKTVGKYMATLGFTQAVFIADVTESSDLAADDLRDYGLGRVEFIICLNPGEPARPLAEVASGGEASRLMLAVKAALQRRLSYATIVFDEIEAGVGGDAAFNVARVLRDLAVNHQVIAVTHLAPVAAAGEQHLEAVKSVHKGTTDIKVVQLDDDQRIRALARMLGDPEHPESLALAEDFLRRMA